ncbi:hypothetical protein N9162_00080 [bacterium]|nr:hypothetical protein [bacterium]
MELSATSIDLINVCVPGINFSKKDSPASLPNMEKESNTASILTLFLVPPLFFLLALLLGAGGGAIVLWGLSLICTAILQGSMSASRKEGRNSIAWSFLCFFAQLLFNYLIFIRILFYAFRGV